MDCRVVVEAAVPVYGVETPDEAVRIAISKTGDRLNPDLGYVEISAAKQACPDWIRRESVRLQCSFDDRVPPVLLWRRDI